MPPRLLHPSLPKPSQFSPSPSSCQCTRQTMRSFSSTHPRPVTKQRRDMFAWLTGPGAVFKDPLPGSTNYLSAYNSTGQLWRTVGQEQEKEQGVLEDEEGSKDMNLAGEKPIPAEGADDMIPFPLNAGFTSQAVLAEDIKDAIYKDVTSGKLTVREASEKYQVEMNRVGAVVRLKSVEAQWKEQGTPLATAYGKAVLEMLPKTTLSDKRHEPINDLPVHQHTRDQMFYPTAESRRFTRKDAGEAFMNGLRPADERIPHPQMIEFHKGNIDGSSQDPRDRKQFLKEKMRRVDVNKKKWDNREEIEKVENTTVVQRGRWDYRFQDVLVDASKIGHYTKGIGARYGVPAQDRKKGQVKIPRSVE